VDASGTTVNVLVPSNAPLTKYEVGTPTTINLTNPTVLTPAGVVVDNYANVTSLDIVNVPDNKSFTMFDKILTNYIYGGYIIRGKVINTNGVISDSNVDNEWITSYIEVDPSITIRVSPISGGRVVELD